VAALIKVTSLLACFPAREQGYIFTKLQKGAYAQVASQCTYV